jgi:hypothetical protein
MDRAVELNADRQAGSNPDARHARGVNTMTARYMGLSAPPDEAWVELAYVTAEGQERETRLRARLRCPFFDPPHRFGNCRERRFGRAEPLLPQGGLPQLLESARAIRNEPMVAGGLGRTKATVALWSFAQPAHQRCADRGRTGAAPRWP